MAVGFKALDQWYSAVKILVRSCRKSGSAVMDTAQCVFPHTFKAPLSTPAKLIKWISVISLRPCRPRQDCEECWSLPREESCHGYPVDAFHWPLTAEPPLKVWQTGRIIFWAGWGWSRWVHSTMITRKQRKLVNKWVQLKYKRHGFFLSDLFGLILHFGGNLKGRFHILSSVRLYPFEDSCLNYYKVAHLTH